MPSGNVDATISGKLAAVIYSSGSALGLKGAHLGLDGSSVTYVGAPIKSNTSGFMFLYVSRNNYSFLFKKYEW